MNPILPPNPEGYTKETISVVVANVLQLALSVAGLIAIIYVLIGAFYYLTAYGSEEKATKGKTTLMWAIIGLVFIAVSKVIITAIWNFVAPGAITATFPF